METNFRKFELPVAYIGDILVSKKWCDAFAKGCGGQVSAKKEYLGGDIALFGCPNLTNLLLTAQKTHQNWFYGDKAYFGRGKYYRVTKNAYMHDTQGEATSKRFDKLGVELKDWQNGDKILICPQSDGFYQRLGTTQANWVENVKSTLLKYTDREIIVKTKHTSHTELMFKMNLRNIWATVVHSSIAGVQSVLYGVPCFATDASSTAAHFGCTDLSKIETPIKPDDRDRMAFVLADNQFTLEELASGIAWEKVK